MTISNPAAARELGIGMVFQHFSLFDALTVTQNIALALKGERDLKALAGRIETVSADYGLPLRPGALVADLSVGERQRIEVVRCLLQEPRLLILDEPTAVLTPQEADQLFVTLERLAGEGCAVLYISHRLEEVKRLCHDATILRLGRLVARVDPQQESAASLAKHMIGTDVAALQSGSDEATGASAARARPALHADRRPLRRCVEGHVDLEVRSGEIVAIAGVAGNGQSELFDAISGERTSKSADAVKLAGAPCGRDNITQRRRRDAAFVPEERVGHAAIADLPLSENLVLTHHAVGKDVVRHGLINRSAAKNVMARVAEHYDVRKNLADPEASALSGGNLQKFVVGREMTRRPSILVVHQPTWGVDAGAAAFIRQSLVDMARSGSAVLMISQDLDEIFEDRRSHRGDLARRAFGSLPGGRAQPGTDRPADGGHPRESRPGCRARGRGVILRLERRSQRSTLMAFLSPVLAIGITLALGAIMFVALGFDPGKALYIYFIEPVTSAWSIEEVIVKAAPLILIGVGLAVCYTANVWNIGAEGQLTMGALVGASIPIYFPDWQSPLVLLLMLVLGIAGGALFAAIPAFLKNRFSRPTRS